MTFFFWGLKGFNLEIFEDCEKCHSSRDEPENTTSLVSLEKWQKLHLLQTLLQTILNGERWETRERKIMKNIERVCDR